ncbi:4Fe-4S dicluster domain-containing protein [Desulfoplanes sp. PS50]
MPHKWPGNGGETIMSTCCTLSFGKDTMNKELAGFFKGLLEKEIVHSLLVPVTTGSGMVRQTLVNDPAKLENVDPFAPVVPVNTAKLVSSITTRPSERKLGVVLRSCEMRALVELVKLKQADLSKVLLVGMDCYGRYENKDFTKLCSGGMTTESFLEHARQGTTATGDTDIAGACAICEFPATDNVDLNLCLMGTGANEICVQAVSDKGTTALETLGLPTSELPSKRASVLEALVRERTEKRNQVLGNYRETIASIPALTDYLASCVNCYNCRVACPVCYCKECVFVTDTFRYTGDQFMDRSEALGDLPMPADTVFYHMTRISHIGTSCIGCGQCTSACPNGIDLMPIFRSAGEKIQKRFDYQAGRSLDEPLPLSVFFDNEFTDVTGQVK